MKLGKPDPGPIPGGGTNVVVLAEDPEAAWPDLGRYFMHEMNAYGSWQGASGVQAGYHPVGSVEELCQTGQYRILTPDGYAAELAAAGNFAFAMLHPMVSGMPPEKAWEHIRLFEEYIVDKGVA